MDRLFVIVGRINNILLLLVLLGTAVFIVSMSLESNRWSGRGAVAVAETDSGVKKSILLNFERVEDITGADTQMMRLSVQEKSRKFSSGGSGGETRNVLFLKGSDKAPRWLFNGHKNLVLVSAQLHEESSTSKEPLARVLYFEYVVEDTNKDGSLSSEDRSNVGISKPDGTGFVEVLHDVSRVLSYQLLDQQHLSVVYQKGTMVKHAKFSVVNMKLESDQEIVEVPNTL